MGFIRFLILRLYHRILKRISQHYRGPIIDTFGDPLPYIEPLYTLYKEVIDLDTILLLEYQWILDSDIRKNIIISEKKCFYNSNKEDLKIVEYLNVHNGDDSELFQNKLDNLKQIIKDK